MSPNPSPPHSSRLENLSLGPQGAAFELDGRLVQLNSGGYAAPVASIQEFYHQALADFYQRSAELTRQQAAGRPPILGRLLSWIGGLFGRGAPLAAAASDPHVAPPSIAPVPQRGSPQTAHHTVAAVHSRTEASAAPAAPPEATSATVTAEAGNASKTASIRRAATPPVLQVVFADKDGVHVIWQLTPTRHQLPSTSRERADSDVAGKPSALGATRSTDRQAKAPGPRLELTYSLDSVMAQRLQDCYGQLQQLGYKLAGLEAIHAESEKPATIKKAPKMAPELRSGPAIVAAVEKSAAEIPPKADSKPSPRKPRTEASPVRAAPDQPNPEPVKPDPSFLPGI